MEIIANVDANRQIADYIIVVSKTCYRLFVIPVTSHECIAGNVIIRYCIIKNEQTNIKQYELDSSHILYGKICATAKFDRDRVFLALPYADRVIHRIETKRAVSIYINYYEIS